jgi:hypothetical protein
MKYVLFQCNVAQEVRARGMKTKRVTMLKLSELHLARYRRSTRAHVWAGTYHICIHVSKTGVSAAEATYILPNLMRSMSVHYIIQKY